MQSGLRSIRSLSMVLLCMGLILGEGLLVEGLIGQSLSIFPGG